MSANTSAAANQDDGFSAFLLIYAIIFMAVLIGAILLGFVFLIGFLLVLFAMVSAGVLSTGILVGMQRRSVAAGFRTILMIVCCLGGVFVGSVGLWLIIRVFHLHWRGIKAAIIGGAGGGIGGLLLGLVVFYIIDVFLRYCRRRLAF
jgi:hypothetical protein